MSIHTRSVTTLARAYCNGQVNDSSRSLLYFLDHGVLLGVDVTGIRRADFNPGKTIRPSTLWGKADALLLSTPNVARCFTLQRARGREKRQIIRFFLGCKERNDATPVHGSDCSTYI